MSRIDRSKLIIKKKGFRFTPFRPQTKHALPLAEAGLSDEVELMAFERGDERRVLLLHEMVYHHIAQGELDGYPYLVTF